MIGRRKQWIKIIYMTLIACLFFSYTKTFAFSSSSLNLPTDEVGQVKTMIANFCNAVLGSSAFIQDGFVYNAQQSAFVYLLCSNLSSAGSSALSPAYFKRASFKDIGFQDLTVEQIDLCDTGSFSNDCNLSTNIPKLFNGIMNDYVNMKQPNLYGLSQDFQTDSDIKGQVDIFSSGYFDGLKICSKDVRSYPKTCQIMQTYIKNVRTILSNVTIFSSSGVLAMAKAKEKTSCAVTTESTDIFYCGLYGEKGASLVSFLNLSYNELFYYRLFMGYYLVMLQKYPSILIKNTYTHDYSTIVKTFSTQYMRSKDALSLSLRMMSDTYMAFPFHIGFLMYQEDLNGFGKSLARIAPPIYTLYDKLRNVQKPQ